MAFSTTHAGTVDGAWYHLLHPASGLLVERIETNLPVHPAKTSNMAGLEDDFPFPIGGCLASMLIFRGVILLMEEILHHLGCIKPGK